jgi:hypothetical protein
MKSIFLTVLTVASIVPGAQASAAGGASRHEKDPGRAFKILTRLQQRLLGASERRAADLTRRWSASASRWRATTRTRTSSRPTRI